MPDVLVLKGNINPARCETPVIPATRRMRQEDRKLGDSLGNLASHELKLENKK